MKDSKWRWQDTLIVILGLASLSLCFNQLWQAATGAARAVGNYR
ncbi:hypothetical protein ACFWMP_27065 [Paenibacillus sp. NPDC058367]